MWFFRKKNKTKHTDPDTLAHGHYVSNNLDIISIKVLGAGCSKCITLKLNTEMALKELNIKTSVEFVKNLNLIKQYNVEKTPALVINEEIVSFGKVLTTAEIKKLIKEYQY